VSQGSAAATRISRIPSPSPYADPIGFCAAVRAGDTVWVSGVSAAGPDGDVVGGDDAYAQAHEVLGKLCDTLSAAGAAPEDVVRTRIFLARATDWPEVGRAHGEVFGAAPPAATMVVAALLDPRMLVEIEAVAYVGR